MNSEKELKVDVYCEEDVYEGTVAQSIVNKENDIYFEVHNLSECPEDAIINRNLFNAEDYIRVLNKGIELAQKGYTKVVGNFIESEEEE